MNVNYFKQLVEDYTTGRISEADQQQFFQLLEQEGYCKLLEAFLQEEWNQIDDEETANPQVAKLIEQYVFQKIAGQRAQVHNLSFLRKNWTMAAAVALLIIAGIVWMVSRKNGSRYHNIAETKVRQNKIDVPPGSNGAILILDNGEQIVLDSIGNGMIARQGGSIIMKHGEVLSYQQKRKVREVVYNTIATPKGRQYSNLVLPDGSRVWLDAGSSIRFPVVFTGTERRVEITGQAWLDVVHNDKMPFTVLAGGVEIHDLGTEFNVYAYEEEQKVKVTLIHGSISVRSNILKPGQQAQVPVDGPVQILNDVAIDDITAWKNGFFSFRGTDVKGIMQQLARWYDVDVKYEGANTVSTFTGKIDRNLNLSEVLKILEKTRVHFRIEEGRKLIILP